MSFERREETMSFERSMLKVLFTQELQKGPKTLEDFLLDDAERAEGCLSPRIWENRAMQLPSVALAPGPAAWVM